MKDGVWIITFGTKVEAAIDAPYHSTATQVLKHWVASQGMTENAILRYKADWCPITKWEGHLAEVFTPFCERNG